MNRRFFAGALLNLLLAASVSAQVPTKMSYQGVLTDGSGAPVADGNHSLVFKLYSVSTAGSALWTETQGSVNTTNGVLSVVLGSVTPIGIAFDGALWLGIEVDGGGELTPRIELTTSPYSFQAKSVDDDAVTSAKIADGTIVSADVAGGEVVTSVNTLKDAITLAAGANVTITPAGNTLTFASSAAGGNNLDMAYDEGGVGVGRTITADNGAVDVQGTGGLTVNGGVGIGTTTLDGGKLRVSTGSGTTPALLMSNGEGIWGRNAGNTNSMFIVGTDGSDRIQFGEIGGAAPNQGMTFQTNGSERVRIDNAGLVGIGIAAPADQLHVDAGQIRVSNSAAVSLVGANAGLINYNGGTGFLEIASNSLGANSGIDFLTSQSAAATSKMRINAAGNVAIGAATPAAKLHVNNGSLLLDGTTGAIPATGAGTRLMWYPAKAAFRAGVVAGTQWDDANIGANSTVGGGQNNQAAGVDATIAGGTTNTASGAQSTVGGGTTNVASGTQAGVLGGSGNTASGNTSTISGGLSNTATDDYGTVAGGWANRAGDNAGTTADEPYAAVGGGSGNMASAQYSTVGGGNGNTVTDYYGTIGGGFSNQAGDNAGATNDRQYATVGGGNSNTASGIQSTVTGGAINVASGSQSFVGGGNNNTSSSTNTTISGGATNTATLSYATVGGGENNDATHNWATVAGGSNNDASEQYSTIAGGINNIASGLYSTVPGGHTNSAVGQFSFAAGRQAKANHDGAFVWGDQTAADFASTAADQFLIRASGGVGIGMTSPGAQLDVETQTLGIAGRFYDTSVNRGVGSPIVYVRTPNDTVNDNTVGMFGVGDDGDTSLLGNLFRITQAGNVGIGTTSPTALLEVAGDLLVGGPTAANKAVYSSANAHLRLLSGNSGGAALVFQAGTPGAPTEHMRIDGATGNVGLGTAVVTEKLMVAGNVVPSADNTYTSGTSALRWSALWAMNGTIQTSDRRLKESIEASPYGLDEVMELRPVSYSWKDQPGQGRNVGLIAQEVQPLIPEAVHVGDDERQTLGLNYADLVPVLAKAIQEQQEIIEQQREQLAKHEAEDGAMRARMDNLNRKLDLLAASIERDSSTLGSAEDSKEAVRRQTMASASSNN